MKDVVTKGYRLELLNKIAETKEAMKLEVNKDPIEQAWLRGRIAGLRDALEVLHLY